MTHRLLRVSTAITLLMTTTAGLSYPSVCLLLALAGLEIADLVRVLRKPRFRRMNFVEQVDQALLRR